MGTIYVKKCDKCGKEARDDTQKDLYDKGFEQIVIRFGSEYKHSASYNYKIAAHEFFLCKDCLKKLGIVEIEKGTQTNDTPSIKNRLYDIVAEIIEETMGE